MAEILGIITFIIAVLNLAKSGVALLRDIKNASIESEALMKQVGFTRSLLIDLKDTLEEAGASSDWSGTIQLLDEDDGPIKCLQRVLQKLNGILAKQVSPDGSKRVVRSLLWPFSKRESEELLRCIEQQKVSLLLALQNNHTRLAITIHDIASEIRHDVKESRSDIREVLQGLSLIGTSLSGMLQPS